MANEQIPTRRETHRESVDNRLLRRQIKINHDIAAKNHIEWALVAAVFEQVELFKSNQVP
jgi:hypothetical protein